MATLEQEEGPEVSTEISLPTEVVPPDRSPGEAPAVKVPEVFAGTQDEETEADAG